MPNKAGASTRQMAQKRRRITYLILFGVLILIVSLALVYDNRKALGLGGGAALFIIFFIRILPDLIEKPINRRIKKVRRADRGAIAEEKIGDLLAGLGEDFLILHDVVCAYGNIDHVVISKNNGVFLLETKAHGGRVQILSDNLLVNGKPPEKDFIKQTLRNTYWLRDELEKVVGRKVWITPVIVFTNAFVPFGKPIKGIHVINKKFLPELLQKQARPSTELSAVWDVKERITQTLGGQS
jgi:hypothetical protein